MDPKREVEKMVKVGPHVATQGNPWDEKGQSLLTQIFISFDSRRVYSIQAAYMIDGKLELSDKHGGHGEIFKTLEIDYPSEFLTGINGCTGPAFGTYGSYCVKCLTFETNRRKIGPFGPEEGSHFYIDMGTKRFFGGFHGFSDANYLYSIGVYLKPINPLEDSQLHTSTPVATIPVAMSVDCKIKPVSTIKYDDVKDKKYDDDDDNGNRDDKYDKYEKPDDDD